MERGPHVNPVKRDRGSRRLLPHLLILLLCAGCSPEPGAHPADKIPLFNGQRAYEEVKALVLRFSPRDAGTPGGRLAAEHLFQRLDYFGVEADIESFDDQTPAGQKTFHNVIGRIPGKTDEWIILGSHFDTMPGIDGFQGANDSGSSTGILLELARMLAKEKPQIGIVFAFFDGEEGIANYIPGDGLHGSRHMARQLTESGMRENIKAMILLDMVGDKDLHLSIPANSSRELAKEILDAAYKTGLRDRVSILRTSHITDDHVPFLEAGIPAIDLIDFKFGSEPGLNDHWHTAADNLKNISAESLEITGKIALQLLKQLAIEPKSD